MGVIAINNKEKEKKTKPFILKFKYSKYRKTKTKSNFNGRLDFYWKKQFNDMFRSWK